MLQPSCTRQVPRLAGTLMFELLELRPDIIEKSSFAVPKSFAYLCVA